MPAEERERPQAIECDLVFECKCGIESERGFKETKT